MARKNRLSSSYAHVILVSPGEIYRMTAIWQLYHHSAGVGYVYKAHKPLEIEVKREDALGRAYYDQVDPARNSIVQMVLRDLLVMKYPFYAIAGYLGQEEMRELLREGRGKTWFVSKRQ